MRPARFAALLAASLAVLSLAAESWAQPGNGDAAPSNQPTATNGQPPASAAGEGDAGATAAATEAPATPDKLPVNIRLRRLEQRVQALKERAWRAKARIGMLKEAVLGGGVGARASIVHENKMGNSYRLLKLQYALDGTVIFTRSDPSGKLHSQKTFDVLTGPIAPGSHTITVVAVYRGNGYGPIKYLNKYKFTVRSSHTFTASEGKGTTIRVVAFEKGGVSTPLEKRPSIDFKVGVATGAEK